MEMTIAELKAAKTRNLKRSDFQFERGDYPNAPLETQGLDCQAEILHPPNLEPDDNAKYCCWSSTGGGEDWREGTEGWKFTKYGAVCHGCLRLAAAGLTTADVDGIEAAWAKEEDRLEALEAV
ncbi:MAG: hypothetical protein IID34_13795 [Planctomycetes bacterium]|nr:hypothetical protein [Planctomycetota bacterium]